MLLFEKKNLIRKYNSVVIFIRELELCFPVKYFSYDICKRKYYLKNGVIFKIHTQKKGNIYTI